MRAAILIEPKKIEVQGVPVPRPGPGEVRVRLSGCGVCASSVPLWEGRPWFDYPLSPGMPGHEGWGVIDDLGDRVTQWRVGTPVAIVSQHAFAEYDLVNESDALALPPQLSGAPFPGEPLGCAFNAFRRSGIQAGQHVAIIGVGFLGGLLTTLCVHAGASVLAVSRRPYALSLARKLGAERVMPLSDVSGTMAAIQEWTGGKGCECVIEATGVQAALDLATDATAIRGRIVIAGYHQDGMRQVDMQKWNWKGLDIINAHERDPRAHLNGMRQAVAAVTDGWLDPARLYTHELSLEQLPEAFEMIRERRDGFVKALVRF